MIKIRLFLFFTLPFLLLKPTLAQVNVFTAETIKQLNQDQGFYNNVRLSFSHHSGNTNIRSLWTRIRSDYITGNYHTFGVGNLQFLRKDDQSFINKGMFHLRGIRHITNIFMFESFVQKQFSESILLKDRNLAGGGLRIAFFSPGDNPKIRLYTGIGTMWENELIDDAKLGKINSKIMRSTNYSTIIWQIDDWISSATTGYFQINPSHREDFRILLEGDIGFRITDQIRFSVRLNLRYDSQPPTRIAKHDLEITNGLSLSF